jgi:predicted nucleic acid-binding protein
LPDWLLDTNAVSALMRADPRVTAWLARVTESETLRISANTNGEIRYGLYRLPAGKKRSALDQAFELLLSQLGQWLDVTGEVSELYARIKASLERGGVILPENDLWIAATAVVHTLILVTNDAHFDAVSDLTVEDWSAPLP